MQAGVNELAISHVLGNDTLHKRMAVVYEEPAPPQPTVGFSIEYVRMWPAGDLWLQPGDPLQVEIKATPGMAATFYNSIPLLEVDTAEAGVAGIYRGEYIIQPFDSLLASVVPFYLHDRTTQKTVMVESRQRVTTLNQPRAHHHKPGTLILWVGHGPAGGCQNG